MNLTTRVPVVTLTGFLGAGKTTLLRRLVANPQFGEVALLINEFGKIGLDHLMFESISQNILLLDSGCVCCQIRGELKDAILSLLDRRSRGELPPFQRIVLETTGLADPASLLSTFINDPVLANQIVPGPVITVVDSLSIRHLPINNAEWVSQVCSADLLVVSKLDMSNETLQTAKKFLSNQNPVAQVLEVSDLQSILDSLQVGSATLKSETIRSTQSLHLSRGKVQTLSIVLDHQVNWSSFGVWLSAVLHYHGERILRVKGLLNIGRPGPVVLNGVQHILHVPEHMDNWPSNDHRSRIIFITENMNIDTLRNSANLFLT